MPTEECQRNIDAARRYIEVYNQDIARPLEECFAEEFEWREMPSPFFPQGRSGGLTELTEAVQFSKTNLRDEQMTLLSLIASGDLVALEVIWEGTVINEVEGLAVGTRLQANLGIFQRFRDGLIISQHEYVCFGVPSDAAAA